MTRPRPRPRMRAARHLLFAALALTVLAGAPAASAGKPVGIAESFPTRCNVEAVAATADGGAWFACTKYTFGKGLFAKTRAQVGRITAAGQVSEFASTAPAESGPTGVPGVVAADGSFWFPVAESFYAVTNYVKTHVPATLARVTPDGQMTLFPVSGGAVTELAAQPRRVAADEDRGRLRRQERGGLAGLGDRRDGEDGRRSEAAPGRSRILPDQPDRPLRGIYTPGVIGADGNLWFGIQSGGSIGRLTPTGELTQFHNCLAYSQPFFGPETLVRGAEGNIWFTSLAQRSLPNIVDPASIGMVTPAGAITQLYAGVKVEPKTIAADSEGGAWFAGGLEEIQRIRPPQGPVNTFHIGKLSEVRASGSGLLTVKVPSAGRLKVQAVETVGGSVLPKTIGHPGVAISNPAVVVSPAACGSPQVRIKLAGFPLHVFKQEEGSVFVRVAVTFTPDGGTPYTAKKILHFFLPHHQ